MASFSAPNSDFLADPARPDRAGVRDTSEGRLWRALRFVRHKGVFAVVKLVHRHGLSGSYAFVARNLRHALAHRIAKNFDRRHGVDTAGSLQLAFLDIAGPNRAIGNESICTSPKIFSWLMARLDIQPETIFVDIGAGKSRTLLLASLHPFAKIIGVEFARELVEISRKNIARFRHAGQKTKNIEIVHMDAADYVFPQTPLVVFFYNPFGRDLFERVIAKLELSLRATPRPCTVVFITTTASIGWARQVLNASKLFESRARGMAPRFLDTVRPVQFAVYELK